MFLFLTIAIVCIAIRPCDGSLSTTATAMELDVTATRSTEIAAVTHDLPVQHRQMAVGDFDSINTIIKDLVLKLQDQKASSGQIELTVSNLQCSNILIGDIQLNYTVVPSSLNNAQAILQITMVLMPFSMDCTADFDFVVGFINGKSSRFTTITENNTVNATIDLIAPKGFDNETPSSSNITLCSSAINVITTKFDDQSVVSLALNALDPLISSIISNQADAAVCKILNEFGVIFFTDFLNSTSNTFDTWLQPIPEEYSDPLLAERNYVPPEDVKLLSFISSNNASFSTSGSIGEFVVNALTEADSLLNGVVDDPTSPTGKTLEVNVFLRNNFLDENGTYALMIDNLEIDNTGDLNPVLYDGETKLSKTAIRINGLRITGLDTMKVFNPLIELGQYTFRNELRWDSLSISLDLTIDVSSSKLDDPILVSEEPLQVTENITLSLDLERIDVNASIFLAIDQNKFDGLPLGSILKDPVICFLSALDTMEVSGLEVSLGKFSEPVLEGFASPGVHRIVATLIEAGFIAYEPTLRRAVPYFFQVPVRDIIKNDIIDQFLGDKNQCRSKAQEISEASVIDFRDLLLSPEDAVALGGGGDSPYGTLMHVFFKILKDEYLRADPSTGLAAVNTKFLADFGLDQSGTSGRLFFPGNFVNQTREVRSNRKKSTIRLRVYDVFVDNIDTVGVPLTLFEPVSGEPYLLDNEASIGVSRPLRFGFGIFFGISNSGTSKFKYPVRSLYWFYKRMLTTRLFQFKEHEIENDVKVFLDVSSLRAMLTVLARVSEKAFMLFPLYGT
jgi:hypothetical protein